MTAATNNLESSNVNTYIAGGTITAGMALMYHSTEGQVVCTTGVTSQVMGVALTAAASGESVDVQTGGVAKVWTSGICTIAVGVVPGANGKCVTEAGAGATALSFGIAEQTTTADASFLRVRLLQALRSPANT